MVLNFGLIIFAFMTIVFGFGAEKIYSVIAAGYSGTDIERIAFLARMLFLAQGFFVVSYVLTGVLESLRRFLIPALAPVLYNLGIILGTIFLSPNYGLMGPVIGVIAGSIMHFSIQLPFAIKLGFRFSRKLEVTEDVKKISKLAGPRVIDLSFDQIGKSLELYIASFLSSASYAYFTFANTLQVLPVSLFGTSLAKAALPILSQNEDKPDAFRKIFLTTICQGIFLGVPMAASLIVLRIPVVRLVYGTDMFDWQATVETGTVLSVFATSIVFQILLAITVRSFFALHDTKTPVLISFIGLFILIVGNLILVFGLKLPVWALAASFSMGCFVEVIILFYLLNKRIGGLFSLETIKRVSKIIFSGLVSSGVMYVFLKFFDQYAWVKRISFLSKIDSQIQFQNFVLDTRYTLNVLTLTFFVFLAGMLTYGGLLVLLKSEEVTTFYSLIKRFASRKKLLPISIKETESISPTTDDRVS